MKILIITQKVDINDDVLGFFHAWLLEFAEKCEKLTVICLQKGKYELPENVKVLSLGKENGRTRLKYLFRFFQYIWEYRKDYEAVFVHMNPVYVVLGGLFWKLTGKKILLWYIHPKIDRFLKMAGIFADRIVSASEKSFPFRSPKLISVGHGIDIGNFKRIPEIERKENSLLFVGRISPIKNLDILIEAINILYRKKFVLNIAGGKDERFADYYDEFRNKIKYLENSGKVNFLGRIANKEIPKIYNANQVLINLTESGSFDKAILEAMACECLVLVSNRAFEGILSNEFLLKENDARILAGKIENIFNLPYNEKEKHGRNFRKYVAENHNIKVLISKILSLCAR